jgi:hypothetical protein
MCSTDVFRGRYCSPGLLPMLMPVFGQARSRPTEQACLPARLAERGGRTSCGQLAKQAARRCAVYRKLLGLGDPRIAEEGC